MPREYNQENEPHIIPPDDNPEEPTATFKDQAINQNKVTNGNEEDCFSALRPGSIKIDFRDEEFQEAEWAPQDPELSSNPKDWLLHLESHFGYPGRAWY
jgi:hypothetical protein